MAAAIALIGVLVLVLILIALSVVVGARMTHKRGPVIMITMLFVAGGLVLAAFSKRIDAVDPDLLRTNKTLLLLEPLPPNSPLLTPEMVAERDYFRTTTLAFTLVGMMIVIMILASHLPDMKPEFDT